MAESGAVQSPQTARRYGIASWVFTFLQFALTISILIVFIILMIGIHEWGWFGVSFSMHSFISRTLLHTVEYHTRVASAVSIGRQGKEGDSTYPKRGLLVNASGCTLRLIQTS